MSRARGKKSAGHNGDCAQSNGHSAKKCSRRGTGVRIAPSLLAADFTDLRSSIRPLTPLSVKWLHLDVMDGNFVPNISFGPGVISQARTIDSSLYFDTHLMIADPRKYVKDFVDAGSQNLTFHVEAAGDDSANLLKYIRRQNCHAGISLKPKTALSAIENYLPYADLVLVMTVEPGFGGQALIPSTLNKVRQLVLLREEHNLDYLIQVDGGIDPQTAPLAVAAGADVLVAGTAVFGGNRIRSNMRSLRASINGIA
ncbi:MAG: ribulose-phosphate 3-epimerase [Candidatus Sumerlaeota bacterium]|nr:ribulose-phosphate 3-epimerase [Candidatus Sumerlaeota bacterium]